MSPTLKSPKPFMGTNILPVGSFILSWCRMSCLFSRRILDSKMKMLDSFVDMVYLFDWRSELVWNCQILLDINAAYSLCLAKRFLTGKRERNSRVRGQLWSLITQHANKATKYATGLKRPYNSYHNQIQILPVVGALYIISIHKIEVLFIKLIQKWSSESFTCNLKTTGRSTRQNSWTLQTQRAEHNLRVKK